MLLVKRLVVQRGIFSFNAHEENFSALRQKICLQRVFVKSLAAMVFLLKAFRGYRVLETAFATACQNLRLFGPEGVEGPLWLDGSVVSATEKGSHSHYQRGRFTAGISNL